MEEVRLTDSLFKKFVEYFYKLTGISIKDYKKYLLESRLLKFVGPEKKFRDFETY
jgi:chemotaxis protein methyltransferase CheR